jgi:hypothetical protein
MVDQIVVSLSGVHQRERLGVLLSSLETSDLAYFIMGGILLEDG